MERLISLILSISSFAIFWLIVPAMMVSLVFISGAVINRTAKGEHKIAAEAGFWGGFMLFIIYFIHELPTFRAAGTSVQSIYQANLWGAFVGILVCTLFLLLLKKIMDAKMIGFLTMILTFCGMASIYSYFFIRAFNDVLLPAILGIAFAVLLYVVISPKTVHALLDQKFQ